jgi:thiol-disulfide isomerase/thioredoxin
MPAPEPEPVPSPQAQDLPTISFTTLDGKSHDMRSLPEKGIILHFWASWCAPCALEFPPLLKKVDGAHGALALVAVSIDDSRENMDKFLARLRKQQGAFASNPHVYWVWDANKDISLKQFDTIRAPESVLIDAHRRMVDKIAGDPGWADAAMGKRLEALGRP